MTANSVALTSGDPAGVGLELALAAWPFLARQQTYFLIADREHLPRESTTPVIEILCPEEASQVFAQGLPLLHFDFPAPSVPGELEVHNSLAALRAVDMAVKLAREERVTAVCTNPLNKGAVSKGLGAKFLGHTQYLADLCSTPRPVMMLVSPHVRVVPVTTHVPLSRVPSILTSDLIRETAIVCNEALRRDFAIQDPRLAVAGLNPHSGEDGTIGLEEKTVILPAIEELRNTGIKATGPHPADTMFHEAAREKYDLAICMYHDQALIPAKTLAFHLAVNVTLGLPIVRTSPDHGTALDIAGKSVSKPSSLIAAITLAGKLGSSRIDCL